MDTQPTGPTTDRTTPLGFMVVPAFLGALIWLYVLLAHMTR